MAKRTRSNKAAKPVKQATLCESNVVQFPKFKEDINAFSPLDDGADYISTLPSETLDQVLSYCILDHEPERTVRMQRENAYVDNRPHALLSLAAMSQHFRDHVENFSLRQLTNNKETYRFKTNAEILEGKKVRRSSRLKFKGVCISQLYRRQ